MRRLGVLAALLVATLAATPAQGGQESNLVIQPGRSIGKVRVGMTFAQVKAALGKPNVVNRRQRTGFTRYVEYDWGWGRWTVGFSGRGDNLRVSLVATTIKRERTKEGIGVGSTASSVQRTYRPRGIRCAFDDESISAVCRLGTATRGETWFAASWSCSLYISNCAGRRYGKPIVYEVLIRTAAAPKPHYDLAGD